MTFELNKKNIILVIVFILLVIIFGIVYNSRYENKKETDSKITLLGNYSRFFTINNSVNSYINYLAKKDTDSLLKLLSEDYQEENNVNKNNILNKIGELTGSSYSFQARKIYQENLSETIVKYYIYGELKEEIIDEYLKPNDYYLILIMDTKNFTYSITPYNGQMFKEGK